VLTDGKRISPAALNQMIWRPLRQTPLYQCTSIITGIFSSTHKLG
jgi:hypothetical protein